MNETLHSVPLPSCMVSQYFDDNVGPHIDINETLHSVPLPLCMVSQHLLPVHKPKHTSLNVSFYWVKVHHDFTCSKSTGVKSHRKENTLYK